MSEQSHQFPQQQQQQSGTNKFFPKTLVSAAPTTAVANHSSVYGTTSTTTNNYPEAYLNQTFKNNIYNPQQQQQQQAQQPPPEQQQSSAPYQNSANIQQPYGNQWGSSQDQDANIITIDKTGNKLSPASRDSPIKGKLKSRYWKPKIFLPLSLMLSVVLRVQNLLPMLLIHMGNLQCHRLVTITIKDIMDQETCTIPIMDLHQRHYL